MYISLSPAKPLYPRLRLFA